MNARILLNFRVSTLCRFLALGSLVAGLGLVGCSSPAATPDSQNANTDDTAGDDLGTADGSDRDGEDGSDATDHADVVPEDGHADADTSPKDVPDGVNNPETTPDTADTGPDAKPDVPPVPPICKEAKGSCALCQLCPAFPICTLAAIGKPELKTYANDCAAMCALNALKWPTEVAGKVWPTECPACPMCTPDDIKTKSPQCVTLTSGAKITVDYKCEVGCVADAKMQADGITPVSSNGACKLKCTDPVASGGAGCLSKAQPICAKEDNKTYNGQCDMENCGTPGCYPIGDTAESAKCVPSAMTKECDGACYDAAKDGACTTGCLPVCGVKKIALPNKSTAIVATSYRNACIAAAAGAQVGDCTGISATPADVCAAAVLYTAKGCCENVPYGIVHPVCASQTVSGKPDLFVTFQNQEEFDCLVPKNDPSWTWQYASACICNCNNNDQPVCGANGFTYQNACQADCYNPPKGSFTYTTGPCGTP